MNDQSEYQAVTDEDYNELNTLFNAFVADMKEYTDQDPELNQKVYEFVLNVGNATKNLLTRYAKSEYTSTLEAKDAQEKWLEEKHKVVKMKLSIQEVSNAINKFKNVSG